MTREDHVIALLMEANPVPDPDTFVVDPETLVRLDTIEQRSTQMNNSNEPTTSGQNRRGWRRNLAVGLGAALVVAVAVAGSAWLMSEGSSVFATPQAVVEEFTGLRVSGEHLASLELLTPKWRTVSGTFSGSLKPGTAAAK